MSRVAFWQLVFCPPAWQRNPAIVKTPVCVFVNKLGVWLGIINPSAVDLQALRLTCPTNSLILSSVILSPYCVTLPLSLFLSLVLFHCVSCHLFTSLALELIFESLAVSLPCYFLMLLVTFLACSWCFSAELRSVYMAFIYILDISLFSYVVGVWKLHLLCVFYFD